MLTEKQRSLVDTAFLDYSKGDLIHCWAGGGNYRVPSPPPAQKKLAVVLRAKPVYDRNYSNCWACLIDGKVKLVHGLNMAQIG